MSTTRRDFLTATGLAGAGLALNLTHARATGLGSQSAADHGDARRAQGSKRLLILGGTGFIRHRPLLGGLKNYYGQRVARRAIR